MTREWTTRIRGAALALGILVAAPAAGVSGQTATPGHTATGAPGQTAAPRTRLVMLGTGTPNADPERSGPASAVVVDGRAYLVDAGVGIVRRAAKAARDDHIPALVPRKLDLVFITHLHSDHTLGLPDLLLTPWVLDRPDPLTVYGPPGIQRMMNLIGQAWSEDIAIRRDGLEPHEHNKYAYRSVVHEILPGVVYQDSLVKVTAFAVKHGSWKHAYGYRFDTPDRSIVFSGDTRPTDAVVDACNGCDVLVHEVYSAERFKTRPPEWQRYHKAFHTSTVELADIARRAHPKLLVLYHELFWGTDPAGLIREIRAAGYTGPVVAAKDLDVF